MALATAAAALSLLSAAHPLSSGANGAFCLPTVGSYSYREGILTTQELVPGTCGLEFAALQFGNRALGLTRQDVLSSTHPEINSIRITDDKKGSSWIVFNVNGKPVCSKSPYTPLPPGVAQCFAPSDVTPTTHKFTQAGLPVQSWLYSFERPSNYTVTFVSVCDPVCDTAFSSLLRWTSAVPSQNKTIYQKLEIEDFSTAAVSGEMWSDVCASGESHSRSSAPNGTPPTSLPRQVPASVFALPAECPQ